MTRAHWRVPIEVITSALAMRPFQAARAVKDHKGDGSGTDVGADLDKMLVHGVDTDIGDDQGNAVPRAGKMAPKR